jgi:MFS family permease
MLCQVPAGLLVDLLGPRRRREALTIAVIGMGIAPLLLTTAPAWVPVTLAMLTLAATTSCLIPTVNAISLAVAGQTGFSERLGRNSRYGSIGAGCGALVMGVCVNVGLQASMFLIAAALTLPTLWAIRAIGPDRAHGIRPTDQGNCEDNRGVRALLRDPRLLVFGTCVCLFSVASAGVLQVATIEVNARLGARSGRTFRQA